MSRRVPWKVVPIRVWPGEMTKKRTRSPFRSGWDRPKGDGYGSKSTLDILDRELHHLGAKEVLLQMALKDSEIRLDGQPYANARPEHPGVVLTFESRHGPLSYPCDAFDDWQSNVHAIALALEALRRVDRYGITKRGEQYTGWKALPPGGESTPTMSVHTAANVLATAAGLGAVEPGIMSDLVAFRAAFRMAAKRTHPDAGGSAQDFQTVQEARQVLEAHFGMSP